jgi:hypothetical protein
MPFFNIKLNIKFNRTYAGIFRVMLLAPVRAKQEAIEIAATQAKPAYDTECHASLTRVGDFNFLVLI